jgi:2,3-bisphosphoglycerate-independent phosphoglycerate mutase
MLNPASMGTKQGKPPNMPKKCIMILLDGLGDRSYPELGYRTPLQAARTPVLDQLSRDGANGLYHAAFLGQALPSENAHFAMFGYDMDVFPGRGALEALGAGIPLEAREVAILTHLVNVRRSADGTLLLHDAKHHAEDEEIRTLLRAVQEYSADDVRVRLHPTCGLGGIITLAGQVAPFVTDSDPMMNDKPLMAVAPWAAYADDAATRNTARVLGAYLEWVHHTLQDHPVNKARREQEGPPLNALVTQRAGRLKKVTPFSEEYGLRGLSIASGIIYLGLAAYLGMDARKVADSAHPGDDLAQRLQTALAHTADYDFIHVHTKTPDEAAHTKNPIKKMQVIEALDQGIGTVLEALVADPELLLVVAADHSTPSSGPLIHSGEPVPLVFHGPGIRRDAVHCYDEVSAAGGALGFVRGKEIMYLILNHLDRAKLQGIMDTPVDQPYWPGHYEPFRLRNQAW